jgi:hypothetical protein
MAAENSQTRIFFAMFKTLLLLGIHSLMIQSGAMPQIH